MSQPSRFNNDGTPGDGDSPNFHTTHWSMVVAAGEQESPQHSSALSALCEMYWYPLYAFARRKGFNANDAQDEVQSFLAFLLEKNIVGVADQQRGKFRTFLLSAFGNHLKNEIARKTTAKRGGGRRVFSMDFAAADHRFSQEHSSTEPPEHFFLRQWATTLLDEVMSEIKKHYSMSGKEHVFDLLAPYLTPSSGSQSSYAVAAEALQTTVSNVKTSVHRLRRRFRDQLRHEIAQTVQDESMVEEEIGELFRALSRRIPPTG